MITYLMNDSLDAMLSTCDCGGRPRMIEMTGLNRGYGVECKTCGRIHFLFESPTKAIQTWNRDMKRRK